MDDSVTYQRQHLVSHVHFREAKCLEVGARGSDGRSDGFHQQLLQVLANKWPHLLQHLKEIHFYTLLTSNKQLVLAASS